MNGASRNGVSIWQGQKIEFFCFQRGKTTSKHRKTHFLPPWSTPGNAKRWVYTTKMSFSMFGCGFHALKAKKFDFSHDFYPKRVFYATFRDFEIFDFLTLPNGHTIATCSKHWRKF